jgi:alkaline phosphatase
MKLTWCILSLLMFAACAPRPQLLLSDQTPLEKKVIRPSKLPKNIVFMVGDGMGISQITAAMYQNGNRLNLEQFTTVGIHKTYSADDLVTDSAAGATAFSCGRKTYNKAIGVGVDSLPCKTILERAEEEGLATGLVVTSTIVHATPAAFVAHVKDRNAYEEIATYFPGSGVDFFVGGGEKYFNQRQKDSRNIVAELETIGYQIFDSAHGDINSAAPSGKKFGYFTAEDDPSKARDGRDYLAPAVAKALNFLRKQSDKGFFLLVEGSQIDWGGHDNDADYIISETLDFDKAIGEALNFAKADGHTLVIVTADHETGGFAINPGSTHEEITPGFSTKKHTATHIPVFAFGPGAEIFGGIYENTAIHAKMMRVLRLDD